MSNYFFLVVMLFLECSFLTAQSSINRLDENGLKTGKWEKKYTNGNIRYTGQFVKDKEVGVFLFYSEFLTLP